MANGERPDGAKSEDRVGTAGPAGPDSAFVKEVDAEITRLLAEAETGGDGKDGAVRLRREQIKELVFRTLNAERAYIQAVQERDEQEKLARIDSLTKLPNRRALIEALNARIGESLRYGDPVSVIMIDIDRFKPINDTHGHNKGDEVLKDLATLFKNCLRYQAGDMVGRYGGEEFICTIPRSNGKAALTAERLRIAVRKKHENNPENTLDISVSAGVATFYPKSRQTAEPMGAADLERKIAEVRENLIGQADSALYCAKRGNLHEETDHGRNQVWVLNEEEAREPFMLTPEKVAELHDRYGKKK